MFKVLQSWQDVVKLWAVNQEWDIMQHQHSVFLKYRVSGSMWEMLNNNHIMNKSLSLHVWLGGIYVHQGVFVASLREYRKAGDNLSITC